MRIVNAEPLPADAPLVQPIVLEMAEIAAKKFIATRFVDEILNNRGLDVIDELFVPHCALYGTNLEDKREMGFEAVRNYVSAIHKAFPDVMFYIQNLIVEDYNVLIHWKARGTNENSFWGYEATGAEMIFYGMTLCTIKFGNQKIVAQWHYWSTGSLLRRELEQRDEQRREEAIHNRLKAFDGLQTILSNSRNSYMKAAAKGKMEKKDKDNEKEKEKD